MPNVGATVFVAMSLERQNVVGKKVLDVGSYNYNGSVAPLVQSYQPSEYVGVDILPGPGVDIVCHGEDLVERFGAASFDIVLCVEVLEHAEHWRKVITNLKGVLRPGGHLIVTTRSYGYPVHGFPHDFWRFERIDFEKIFADMEIASIQEDNPEAGIFISAIKPQVFKENSLENIDLYSVLTNTRCIELPINYKKNAYYKKVALKQKLRNLGYAVILGSGKKISKILGVAQK
jgi:SAM-dependent methyltransferase